MTSESKTTFIDLFAGIGGMRIALESLGCQCVFSSEIDQEAAKSYEAFFGETPSGDITQIPTKYVPAHDILVAGFPCQTFSIAGTRAGFSDMRGLLFLEIERILLGCSPKAFLLENVKNLVSHDKKNTFEYILMSLREAGYKVDWKVLNALDFNLPQKRERVLIVGFKDEVDFKWPSPVKLTKSLADILEPDELIENHYFASEQVLKKVQSRLEGKALPAEPWICHENILGNRSAKPYSCALRAGASYNYLLVNGKRRLTSRENLRLQGFPDNFPIEVSYSAIRKQTGNSVPIPMIRAVAEQMLRALSGSHASKVDW
jgi:DNA (cytosine-5)-methyltransferase 1